MLTGKTFIASCIAAWAILSLSGCHAFDPAAWAVSSGAGPRASEPPRSIRNSDLPPQTAAEACIASAEKLQEEGKPAEALALYEQARSLDPHAPQINRRLAVLYDLQGNDARARAEYYKALQNSPRDADLLNDFGFFYYRRHDWRQAAECFRKATAVAPEHERAWVNLGLALGEEENFQESFEAFSRVLGPAKAYANLGVILVAHHRPVEAKTAFERALALQPDLAQARAFLADLEKHPPATAQK
jgi:Tfp pilus assembly protein PilF